MTKFRLLILVMFLVLITACNMMYGEYDSKSGSELNWEHVSPESQGIRSDDLIRMFDYIDSSNIEIDSILIYRNGTIPLEAYFKPYSKHVSHNLKSTSKGVISALVGIALREGFIEDLDDSILSYFPEYNLGTTGKADITIRDLLTMSSGLNWNENDLNSMYTFFVSKRIVKRVLNLEMASEPGTTFNYNTGLTHLLSAIITKSSGMNTMDFAEQYLFGPMNIYNTRWDTDRDGVYIGGSELFLTPRAMMKFGVMYLDGGKYAGQQVIPEEWIAESTTNQIEGAFNGTRVKYGYLWWLNIENQLFSYLENENDFLALGVHGQRIFVSRELDAVVVITADQKDESQCDILIRDYIVPAMSRDESLPENPEAEAKLQDVLISIKQ